MTVSAANDVYFDPYDVDLIADPYPMFRGLREEAPLYYNEQHDFSFRATSPATSSTTASGYPRAAP